MLKKAILPSLLLMQLAVQTTVAEDKSYELDPVVISATRVEALPQEQPFAIYRHDAEELDFGIGRTALDRLDYGPGVLIQRTAPSQASPFIRGLTGEQSLLLLDGVRLSHAMMRPGPNQYAAMIPGYSVSHVDALLGTSSVVQGSDGLTGAIDFRLAPASRGFEKSSWGDVLLDYANGYSLAAGLDGGASKEWLYSVEVGYRDYHNRIGGNDANSRISNFNSHDKNEIPNTAYSQWSSALRTAYVGMDRHRWEINLGYIQQMDTPRPDGYSVNSFKSSRDFRRFDRQAFTYLHLRDRWDIGSTFIDSLTSTLAWHKHEEEQRRGDVRNSGGVTTDDVYRLREKDDEIDSYSLDLEAKSIWNKNILTWGLTLTQEETGNQYREYRSPAGNPSIQAVAAHSPATWPSKATVNDGSEYDSIGVYLQNDQQISSDWGLLYGVRFSQYDWSFGQVDGDASDVTWNVRAQKWFAETKQLFAGVSRAFRAPNLTNLNGASDRASNNTFAIGNPNLDPESSITTELGWKTMELDYQYALTVFNTEVKDLIQRVPGGAGNNTFDNLEGASLRGVEFDSNFVILGRGDVQKKKQLSLFATASYVRAKVDIPTATGIFEDNISRANRFYGKLGLKWNKDESFAALLQSRWHDAYDDVATFPGDADSSDVRLTVPGDATGAMPGYAVFDIRADWFFKNKTRNLGLGIENILNKTYRAPGSGADGSGRNVFLEYKFRM